MIPLYKVEGENECFALVPDVLDAGQCDMLLTAVAAAMDAGEGLRRGEAKEGVYGIRNLLDTVPAVRALANAPVMRAMVEPILGEGCFPVRGILFDKTPDAKRLLARPAGNTHARTPEPYGDRSDAAGRLAARLSRRRGRRACYAPPPASRLVSGSLARASARDSSGIRERRIGKRAGMAGV